MTIATKETKAENFPFLLLLFLSFTFRIPVPDREKKSISQRRFDV
jgi:hypothetical protein